MDWNSTLIPFNGFRVKVSIQCCAFNLCVLDFSRAHQLFFCCWDVHFFMCVKFMNNGFPNCIQFRWKWTMAAYNLLVGHCLQPGDDTLCAERTYYFLICYSIISYFHCVIILHKMSPVASIRQFLFFVSVFFLFGWILYFLWIFIEIQYRDGQLWRNTAIGLPYFCA